MVEPNPRILAMNRHTRYPNAPITEAVIDIQVQLPSDTPLEKLARTNVTHALEYPINKPLRIVSGEVKLGQAVTATATESPLGVLFQSSDGKQIYQARFNGFGFSRLAPYECWENLRNEARILWNEYKAAVTPQKILRVAVRFINKINIPFPFNDFGEYLRTAPGVSPELPQGLDGFFMRLMIPFHDIKSKCLLNETIIDVTPNFCSIVLDIDVFRTESLPSDDEEIWKFLETLRDRKNSVFEACITDKARELFRSC